MKGNLLEVYLQAFVTEWPKWDDWDYCLEIGIKLYVLTEIALHSSKI